MGPPSSDLTTAIFPQARHYYQIIKRPMDLSVIRAKLSKSHAQHYLSPDQFIADVFLMFRNCAKFNYVGRRLKCDQVCSGASNNNCYVSPCPCSPTRRWPRRAAVWRRSSSRSSDRFFPTERSLWPRRTPTATSTTRPAGQRGAVSPGPRGGSSATERGRGEIPSSPEDTTSNKTKTEDSHGHACAAGQCLGGLQVILVFIGSPDISVHSCNGLNLLKYNLNIMR